MESTTIKKARLQWDFQIARYVGSLKVAWALAIISTACLLVSLFYIGGYLQKPRLIPYVVEIHDDGRAEFKGVVQSTKVNVTDAAVRSYLERFITHLRSISSDLVVLKGNLVDLYAITTPSAQRQVTEMIAQAKPFEQSSHGIRNDVRFTLFEKVAQNTWRAEWIEEIRDQGNLKDTVMMAGTFTYTQGFPITDVQAERNPFGIYFTEFFITQRRGQ